MITLHTKKKVIDKLYKLSIKYINKYKIKEKQSIIEDDDWHDHISIKIYDSYEYHTNINTVLELLYRLNTRNKYNTSIYFNDVEIEELNINI